jgi:arabinofuranosyltransferase
MSTRTKILLGFLVAALAVGARILPGPRTIDDAYITFRYARNLLEGNGPVFNPGQPVLGTTTPLYMGILAAVSLPLGGGAAPFPEIALLINALADALTCLLLIRIGSTLRSPAAGWASALLWAVSPMSVTFAVGGLETSVYILLLISVLYFRLQEKLNAMSVLAGLAFLTRPDALILVVLVWAELAFSFLRRNGFRAGLWKILRVSLPFLLILIGWSAFAFLYYGTLLPHSLLAKSVAYRLDAGAGMIRLIQQYGTPFFEQLTFGTRILAVTAPLYLFLSIVGIRSAERMRPGAGAAAGLAYPWLYFVIFSAANPLIFRWYLLPPLPFMFLSIFLGLENLIGLSRSPQAGSFRIRKILFGALAAGALVLSLREWKLTPDHGPAGPAPEMAFIRLELLYRQVAEDLQARMRPGYTVASGDVGVLGYFLDAPILDTVGLNSPEAVRFYPLPKSMYAILYAIPPDLILSARPEIVVFLEAYGRNGLLLDSRFLDAYRMCGEYPTDMYGSRSLLVYCRRDLP